MPEPDQKPGYRAQFARQESSTEEEFLSSEEEIVSAQQQQQERQSVGRFRQPESRLAADRGVGLAVREALVWVESGLNRMLEVPVPGPRRRPLMERPLIGGRRVPIEDPIWESFDQYREEHRAAVARQQQSDQDRQTGNFNDESEGGEDVDR